ncbi:MAG: EamA family transporter RarD [Spirochaetales bacterium]|nr:EamA family transporter RarD [Spirochaetales bacterium]
MIEKRPQRGFAAGLGAYLLWGILPIYWKQLGAVPPMEQLAWRVLGCAIISWVWVLSRGKRAPKHVFTKKTLGALLAATILIAANWGTYIWALSVNRMVEASLGYYINPLVNVVLGVVFLSEKLAKRQRIAVALASLGVLVMTLFAGVFPWVSLILALCFGFYGLVVKTLPSEFDSIETLAWLMAFLGPLAAGYLLWCGNSEAGLHLVGYGSLVTTLLLLSGFVTLIPLWLFGIGARSLPLSVLGFLQYVAPSIMLLLGVLVYKEPFGLAQALTFVLILSALGLSTTPSRDS